MHKVHQLSLVTLVAIGLTAGFLIHRKGQQRLGRPGVRLVLDPLTDDAGRRGRTNAVELPAAVTGYESRPGSIASLEISHLPADTSFGRRLYRDPIDGFEAQVNVVTMGTERTSIHRPQQCLPFQGWKIEREKEVPMRFEVDGKPVVLKVRRLDSTSRREIDGRPTDLAAVYVYWFVADGLLAANTTSRHLQSIRQLLLEGELPRWSYVSFFTVCPPGREDAVFDRLTHLLAATVPRFQTTGFAMGAAPR